MGKEKNSIIEYGQKHKFQEKKKENYFFKKSEKP
jgi:hypothetical protein